MKKILLVLITILTFTVSKATVLTYTVDGAITTSAMTNITCSAGDTVNISVQNATMSQKFFCPFGTQLKFAPIYGNYVFQFVVAPGDINQNWAVYDENGSSSVPLISGNIFQGVTTSIKEVSKMNVKVFPNPTSDYINIELDETIKNVSLYDLSGKLVLTSTESKVNVSDIAKGTYTLKVNTDKSVGIKTVILN